MICNMPGLPVHHHLLEFTQTHVHGVCDAIQPSHSLSSPSPPAPNPHVYYYLYIITSGERNGNPLQYSCLKNSMDSGTWEATVHGVTKSQTRLSDFTSYIITGMVFKNNF